MAKYKEVVKYISEEDFKKKTFIDQSGKISDSGVKIIRPVGYNYKQQLLWENKCGYCENLFLDLPARILNNHTKSCGCLKGQNAKYKNMNIKYSFYDWCIDNNHQDYLDRWDYDLNTVDPWKISKASGQKVWIKCQEKDYHGSYQVTCDKFNTSGCRCYYCNKNSGKVHKFDSLGYLYPEVLEIWSDKNIKTPYKYAPMSENKVWFKCKNSQHKDYQQAIHNAVMRDFRCPECIRELDCSVLQHHIEEHIYTKYKYILLHEHNCTLKPINPKTKYIMPFDNEILELKLIIEVHGIQHYQPCYFTEKQAEKYKISVEEAFAEQQWRDEYKKQYAINHGYEYLEIPYTEETNHNYKRIIDEKIKQILNNKILHNN